MLTEVHIKQTTQFSQLTAITYITYYKNISKRGPRVKAVVPKMGGAAPWGAVGLPRWALIGTRGGRERCYYHRGALVDK
jgi:hypothetical protein